jgi:hypothetical protein
MIDRQPSPYDAGPEPAPRFASDTDIALAEALRRRLEERYFGRPVTPAALPARRLEAH